MFRKLGRFLTALLAVVPARGEGAGTGPSGEPATHLAFVLLGEAKLPSAETIAAAYSALAPAGKAPGLRGAKRPGQPPSSVEVASLSFPDGSDVVVALMPVPVPKGEADEGAQWSLLGALRGWRAPPHVAHLAVLARHAKPLAPLEGVRRFTWLLAAVAKASSASAIYWADSGATHQAEYFVETAGDPTLAVSLWSGLSIASDKGDPERMSLLSVGMSQLGLLDVELSVPRTLERGEAVALLFDLLSYEVKRGAAPAHGDTVGTKPGEKWGVRHSPSPIDPKRTVWRVEVR